MDEATALKTGHVPSKHLISLAISRLSTTLKESMGNVSCRDTGMGILRIFPHLRIFLGSQCMSLNGHISIKK